ncbi:MAG: GAF domain-containing protein, partial [Candidatus Aminicenantes bacterium]|nr:GAF domain-containing protein [Candidatus Aminicenantes bacterium]
GEHLLGLLSVNSIKNGRPCTEDGLDIVKNYAVEALKALESEEKKTKIPEIEKMGSEIDNLIIRESTPESRLQILVDEVHRLTKSDSVNIRYRDGNDARLLPIGKGKYNDVLPQELTLNSRNVPSVRVIISGREEILGNATSNRGVMEFRQSLPGKEAELIMDVESLCFQPLIFQNRCIGRLGLYKKEKNHFGQKRTAIARIIAERMALLLHDYLVNIERMIKDYALDSSINAIAFTDLEGDINYINNSFLRLLGYTKENEVLLKNLKEFCADKDEASIVFEALNKKGSWRGELLGRKKNGSKFDVLLSASLVRDRIKKPIGTMISFIDITERKRLEKVQKAIYNISEAVGSVQYLEEWYLKIHEIINNLIPANNFYIALYDEKNQTISFPYFIDQEEEKPSPREVGKGMTEYVLRTGDPILAPPEVVEDLAKRGEIEIVGPLCIDWLGVPLKTRENKVIGVLAVQTYEEGLRYTEKDKDMLVFVSEQIAMAIERKQAEEQIISSLNRNEVLLKEIHHRVKNNLAIIYELLNRQSDATEDPGFLASIESNRSRVKSMALIHETLYQSDELAEIDSELYINNLINHLRSVYGKDQKPVKITCNIDDITMNIDDAIPCGLIINELVTNALKYAFPGDPDGEITIRLRSGDNNAITLIVSDNGVGLPESLELSEVSTLGLHLVNILSRQLEASVSIERDTGTRFIITFNEEK